MITSIEFIGFEMLDQRLSMRQESGELSIISIRSHNKNHIQFNNKLPGENLLCVAMDDVAEWDDPFAIDERTADLIISFIAKLDEDEREFSLFCQCEAGISRSSAVALYAASVSRQGLLISGNCAYANPLILQTLVRKGPSPLGWGNLLQNTDELEKEDHPKRSASSLDIDWELELDVSQLLDDVAEVAVAADDYGGNFKKEVTIYKAELGRNLRSARKDLLWEIEEQSYRLIVDAFIDEISKVGVNIRYPGIFSLKELEGLQEKIEAAIRGMENEPFADLIEESYGVEYVSNSLKVKLLPIFKIMYEFSSTSDYVYYRYLLKEIQGDGLGISLREESDAMINKLSEQLFELEIYYPSYTTLGNIPKDRKLAVEAANRLLEMEQQEIEQIPPFREEFFPDLLSILPIRKIEVYRRAALDYYRYYTKEVGQIAE